MCTDGVGGLNSRVRKMGKNGEEHRLRQGVGMCRMYKSWVGCRRYMRLQKRAITIKSTLGAIVTLPLF